MVGIIRELRPSDKDAMKRFFLSLSDRTVFLFNRFNGRYGNVNTEEMAEVAASSICSEISFSPEDERGWIVIGTKGNISGYGFLRFFPSKPTQKYTCSLGLVVADAYQGQGVGSQLMRVMIEEARKLGMRKIWLQTYEENTKARQLYVKFGFFIEATFVNQEWRNDEPLNIISMALFLFP